MIRSGAEAELAEAIFKKIKPKISSGISTRKIYRLAFRELRRYDNPSSSRYETKWAIARLGLGGEGFSFEQFAAKIFEKIGYTVRVNEMIRGKSGIMHEVDIAAEKSGEKIMIECKHHDKMGLWVNIQTPLYVYARFLDLQEAFTGAMIVTNSRFSEQSEVYSRSVGLKLMGWNYPPGESLQELVDKYAVYPITVLHSVDGSLLRRFLSKRITTIADLIELPASWLKNIAGNQATKIRQEAESIASKGNTSSS